MILYKFVKRVIFELLWDALKMKGLLLQQKL